MSKPSVGVKDERVPQFSSVENKNQLFDDYVTAQQPRRETAGEVQVYKRRNRENMSK